MKINGHTIKITTDHEYLQMAAKMHLFRGIPDEQEWNAMSKQEKDQFLLDNVWTPLKDWDLPTLYEAIYNNRDYLKSLFS